MFYSKSTNLFYCTEIHGSDIPTDVVSVSQETYFLCLDARSQGKDIIADENGNPAIIDVPKIPLTWNEVRLRRNALLKDCDWTQIPDVPVNIQKNWAEYRSALRNIPQTFSTPDDVVWPTAPDQK